ncbi:hypothetical protein BDEG_21352 [Batrachochytrium dendrobatidis JEL423]|uniref:Uncharacterized protein n=1 Tax=Batrachochytrium dendrobatidis (strain JEL423) TaxID=403673 RepID=A0A177WB30_BATDL|nr:hypothetical protein BDEG_21352 [Batrachochytrium dendrobatidis JEL423]
MPEKDDIDCQEMPELFHDYYGIKINKDYSGIDVKHPNDIEKHYSGKPKILFDNGNYQPKTGVFDMFEANTVVYIQRHSVILVTQYLTVPHSTSIDQFLTVFNAEMQMGGFTQSNPEYIQERDGKLADMLRYCFKIKQTI